MAGACVSIYDFRSLEQKVNQLLVLHELDSMLTNEEKKLIAEAKADIIGKRKSKFVNISEL